MPRLGGALLMATAMLLARPVHGSPGNLASGRIITAGQGNKIMGAEVMLFNSILINLKKGATSITCGSRLTPGDTGLTFEVSGQGLQYVVEAIASAGTGSWGIQGGKCSMQRQDNAASNTYTVPVIGTVTVRVAGASAKGQVAVSPDCEYTVTTASTPSPSSPTASPSSSPSSGTTACAARCFLGSQGSFCLDRQPPAEQCYQKPPPAPPGLPQNDPFGNFSCVLHRYKCTQESACFLGTGCFKPGEKWEGFQSRVCDENVRVKGASGYLTGTCSAEDVKRGTVKWVAFATSTRDLSYYNLEGQKIQSQNCSSDAELCVCSSELCNAPSKLELSDSPENNCAYALKDWPERPTPAPPVTINNYITVIVLIIQFKTPYQISELTPEIVTKIATAVANVIGVNANTVSLTFVEVDLRRQVQQKGVLVNVGLKDFQGPTAPFASRLTQDDINIQMTQLGLRSVQVINSSTPPPSVKPASSAVRMLTSSATATCVVLAASLLMASLSV